VQAALENGDGVSSAVVDFANKTVVVTYEPGTDTAAMVKALEGTKFTATVKE
jgi:copper chaperone CopZ